MRDCKRVIHQNPSNSIRVQIDNYRLLLHPSNDGGRTRLIDGYSDLGETYRFFNNIGEGGDMCSEIHNAGEVYIDHYKGLATAQHKKR